MPVLVFKRSYALPADAPGALDTPGHLYTAPDRMDAVAAAATTTLTLVATGAVMGADPDRLIIKRIVLSGYPLRVKQRHAMVKYMFFNPDDIEWFRPIELYTKHGCAECLYVFWCLWRNSRSHIPFRFRLVGHIREPVGTHGHMKCRFDAPIKQHDTVRVFVLLYSARLFRVLLFRVLFQRSRCALAIDAGVHGSVQACISKMGELLQGGLRSTR
jgi:hypothetical protein